MSNFRVIYTNQIPIYVAKQVVTYLFAKPCLIRNSVICAVSLSSTDRPVLWRHEHGLGRAPLFWQLLRPAATRESRQRRERPISAQRSRARMGGCLLACLLEKFMEPCALVQRPGKQAKRDDRLRRGLKPQADRARSSSARPLSRPSSRLHADQSDQAI